MIYQLHLAGILARQQALVLGQFTGARPFDYDNGYDMQAMIEQVRGVIGIPIVTGLQFGHVPDLLTLPFGARRARRERARFQADDVRLSASRRMSGTKVDAKQKGG